MQARFMSIQAGTSRGNCAGAVRLPMQMCPRALNLEFHNTGELRWWLLYMRNPPLSTRVDFSITLWMSIISKLSPYFPPFSVHFRYLSPKQLATNFRFITALTVQSIIIIFLCFGPRFVTGKLKSQLDSNALIISPFRNILRILIIYIDTKENKGTSSYNLLRSHPSCFYFLFSQCTYLKHWTSATTQSKRLKKEM